MILLRKLNTFRNIIATCSNWPEISLVKLGLSAKRVGEIRLRNGLVIGVDRGVRDDWGVVFEPAIVDVYGAVGSDADLFIDVGTHIGCFSCLAAYTHPSARVYAFDPNAAVAAQAERNFARNKLCNVTLVKSAVTEDGREVEFAGMENPGSANIYNAAPGAATRLSSTTLDCVDFARAESLFVKLDCEGAEGEIVGWLVAHLKRLPPRVRVACNITRGARCRSPTQ